MRALACAAVLLALVAAPQTARAQDAAALATRRTLVDQATAARLANDHARALDLAERAARISMSPSLRLFIAQEQNSLGRLADALGNADQCAREAAADTVVRNRGAIEQTCQTLAASLRPRVAHVTVQVPSPAPAGLAVRVNGRDLGDALWNAPYVVDAGTVVIEANAPGFRPLRREVSVAAGGAEDVPLALEAAPVETHVVAPPAPREVPPPPPPRPSYVGPIVLLGVGAAGMIAFGVFGGLRGAALARCPGNMCPDAATRDSVYAMTTGANVSVAIGGAGLVAGAVWLIVNVVTSRPAARPRSADAPPRAALHLHATPLLEGGALVGASGVF